MPTVLINLLSLISLLINVARVEWWEPRIDEREGQISQRAMNSFVYISALHPLKL